MRVAKPQAGAGGPPHTPGGLPPCWDLDVAVTSATPWTGAFRSNGEKTKCPASVASRSGHGGRGPSLLLQLLMGLWAVGQGHHQDTAGRPPPARPQRHQIPKC